MPVLRSLSPVLPVADLDRAIRHYESLGFVVDRADEPDGYAFAARDSVVVHLTETPGHDPLSTASQVYVYVDDADAVHEAWSQDGIGGRAVAPADVDYGLREGAHVDPDGNLLRYGAPILGAAGAAL